MVAESLPSDKSLTIAISTLGQRAKALVLPPPDPDIAYLILVQRSPGVLDLEMRDDVTVVALSSLGLSNSRNAALERARTPLLMFADDDVTLHINRIKALMVKFVADARLSLAAGQLAGRRRGWRPRDMRPWNTARINSSELMVRPQRILDAGVAFDPDFGLGGLHPLGEEFVFVADARAAGLRGRHFPIEVATHPGRSSGQDWSDPALISARIATLQRVFKGAAPLMRALYALKHGNRLSRAPGGLWGFVLGKLAK